VMINDSDILKKWQLLSPYLDRRQQICWAAAETLVISPRRLSAVGRCNRYCGLDDIGPETQNETDQICAGWKSDTEENQRYRPKAD
jgi:hypothetical protein